MVAPISNSWLTHCKDQKDKDEMKRYLKTCRDAFDILEEIIQKEIETTQKSTLNETMYDSPNWQLKHADAVGAIRAYSKIKEYLSKTS
jgi:hypothetical protein